MTDEKKTGLERGLNAISNLAKMSDLSGSDGKPALCTITTTPVSVLNLISHNLDHPYGYLEERVNFPGALSNEMIRKEGEEIVKYVLEVTNLRVGRDKNEVMMATRGNPKYHPVVHGDFKLTKYRVVPVKEKIKKPIRTIVMKKKLCGLTKPKRIDLFRIIEKEEIVEEEVDTGKRKDVEMWSIEKYREVFMRTPDFDSVVDDVRMKDPYKGDLIHSINNLYDTFRSIKEWRDSNGMYCLAYDNRWLRGEEEKMSIIGVLKTLIYHPAISGKVADKFRQVKALCKDSKG